MLVSVAQFRQHMGGVKLTPGQEGEVGSMLSGLQGDLELWLNRPVEKVFVRERVYANHVGFLRVSASPVLAVFSLSLATIYLGDTTIESWTDVPPIDRPEIPVDMREYDKAPMKLSGQYKIAPGGVYGGSPNQAYMIEYIGGGVQKSQQDAIANKIKEIAAAIFVKRNITTVGLRSGEAEAPTDPDRALSWTDDDKRAFDRLRRRVIR